MMVRTQIQLDQETWEALRYEAFKAKRSLSAIIRDTLKNRTAKVKNTRVVSIKKFSFVGSGKSSNKKVNVSEDHDQALVKTFLA